ncbi:hypothetical protein HX109_14555 [Galbibacter sp. BG1]|uniref:hypothetical protein n=1 Tax=Galbibacter sp. BG1 TaxID=1170699 RepID=UPI0015B8BE26|nr:hypothetical protein [Galbibacter sp. BG1]QLE02722.1 hypothetical protein HX109_14555 [Galbibacter sp. BG1]
MLHSHQKAFEHKLLYLSNQNSNVSSFIKKIQNSASKTNSLFIIFDDFAFKLGIGIIADAVHDKNFKCKGFIPCFKYYPDNLLDEEPRTINLLSYTNPLNLNDCYAYLAEELVYRGVGIKNLDDII